ncbi:MAG: O-antigen ligase family protein [Phycisphaerae bacterium]
MTPARSRQPVDAARSSGGGAALRNAAFALLLAIMVSRIFLSELPYRTSAFPMGAASVVAGETPTARQHADVLLADRTELARVTFAVGLLTAVVLWLLAGLADRRLEVRRVYLAWLISAFAILSLASALAAADRRTALDVWLEQVSLLSAGFLTVQLCADRRRFAAVVIVLAAAAMAMAVKGYYQVLVEIPDRIADFKANTARRLAEVGIEPGTPRARLFESRVRDPAPTGFFSLANVFASLMVVLIAATAGLAVDKFRAVRSDKRSLAKGEIDVGLLACLLTLAVALAAAPVWLMTGSMGAIGSGVVVVLVGVAVFVWRDRLARHWRKAVAAAAVVWLAGSAAVVGYGLLRDRLPTKTMTFRWYYWTASAEIVGERPVLGTGPGNFPDAYLRHRRPAGEEAVKNPHNAVMHALSEHGLPGGVVYLAIPVAMLIAASRPRKPVDDEKDVSAGSELSRGWVVAIACGVTLAVFAARAVFSEARADALLLVLDALLPAVVVLIALAVASLGGSGLFGGLDVPATASRIALGVAATGFLLHNMVGFSLWAPATGLVFYVALGAALAQAGGGGTIPLRRSACLTGAAGIGVLLAAVCVLWWPVYEKTAYYDRAAEAVAAGRPQAAQQLLSRAAEADALDPLAAGDVARFTATLCPDGPAGLSCLSTAANWAAEAAARNPASARWQRLAGELEAGIADVTDEPLRRAEALRRMRAAVDRDPMNMRIRLPYAEMLLEAGRGRDCLEQLQKVEEIDNRLRPESVERLTPDERERLERLRRRAVRMQAAEG